MGTSVARADETLSRADRVRHAFPAVLVSFVACVLLGACSSYGEEVTAGGPAAAISTTTVPGPPDTAALAATSDGIGFGLNAAGLANTDSAEATTTTAPDTTAPATTAPATTAAPPPSGPKAAPPSIQTLPPTLPVTSLPPAAPTTRARPAPVAVNPGSLTPDEQHFVDLLNQARAAAGVRPVQIEQELTQHAHTQACGPFFGTPAKFSESYVISAATPPGTTNDLFWTNTVIPTQQAVATNPDVRWIGVAIVGTNTLCAILDG